MSKYIIDIPDGVEWGVVTCRTEDGFYTRDFDSLEVLNSDYINEHFGDLQDTAYQKGINDGSLDVKQRVEGAYQKGFEDGKAVHEKGCEGCLWEGSRVVACTNCCNAYKNKWIAKDDKPIIGEVVERYLNGKRDGVGMFLGEDGDYWNCLFWTGAIFGTFAYPSNQFKRTGNVCNITKILEAMKHD